MVSVLYGPCLYNLGNDQTMIWWLTDTFKENNKVVWYPVGATSSTTTNAVTSQVQDSFGNTRFAHKVKLTGLTPATVHYYTIQNADYVSPQRLFTTYSSTATIKIGVFGGSEDSAGSTMPGLGFTVSYLKGQGVTSFLGTGGYTGEGSIYENWTAQWLNVANAEFDSLGFSGCRGETDGGSNLARAFLPLWDDDYFELSIGRVRVVGLSSIIGPPRMGLRSGGVQNSWLLNVASQRAEWRNASYRVILVHHPFRTSYWNVSGDYGTNGTDEFLEDNLHPLIKQSGTDLVLFGRSHSYQRGVYQSSFYKNQHTIQHIVTGGAGSPKHFVRSWNWAPPEEPNILSESANYNALVINASSQVMTVEAHDLENAVVMDSVQVAPHNLFV